MRSESFDLGLLKPYICDPLNNKTNVTLHLPTSFSFSSSFIIPYRQTLPIRSPFLPPSPITPPTNQPTDQYP